MDLDTEDIANRNARLVLAVKEILAEDADVFPTVQQGTCFLPVPAHSMQD